MRKIFEGPTIGFSPQETEHLRSMIQQIVDTDNPVTISVLKGCVAKEVGRKLGFTEKQLVF